MTRHALGYQYAIAWIAQNDDTEWLLDDPDCTSPSVTACLVADLYGRTTEEVARDLKNWLRRHC